MDARRRRLRWSPGLIRATLAGHSLLGLALGVLVYQVSLTGTVSVFAGDLQRWEQPNAPVVTSITPQGYARLAEQALAHAKGGTIIILGPKQDRPRLEIRRPGAVGGAFSDADGNVREPVNTPWTSFVVELHDDLHLAPPWGRIVVGLGGVAMLALIITGLCTHSRIFRDAFHLRVGGATRLYEADLHNRMSVWALPFHIAVALTGAILALGGLLGPVFILLSYGNEAERGLAAFVGPQPAAERAEPADLPDLASLIRQIEVEHAPAKVSFIKIEQAGTAGQLIKIDTNAPNDLASGEGYQFSSDGRYLGTSGYTAGPAGKQMIAALAPLHYGSFGGLPIRLIYGALGLALCAVCATGVNIWLIRRRERGCADETWTRAWVVVVWGQVIALAIASLTSYAGLMSPLVTYVVVTIVLFTFVGVPVNGLLLRRCLRLCAAALIALAVAANILAHGFGPTDAMATAVNVVLIGGALLLGATALRSLLRMSNTEIGRDGPLPGKL